jgi:hypothetical protein
MTRKYPRTPKNFYVFDEDDVQHGSGYMLDGAVRAAAMIAFNSARERQGEMGMSWIRWEGQIANVFVEIVDD